MPRRHQQQKSVAVRFGEDARFRAVCSCGWESDEVRANRVQQAWEDHVDEVRREAAEQNDAGS